MVSTSLNYSLTCNNFIINCRLPTINKRYLTITTLTVKNTFLSSGKRLRKTSCTTKSLLLINLAKSSGKVTSRSSRFRSYATSNPKYQICSAKPGSIVWKIRLKITKPDIYINKLFLEREFYSHPAKSWSHNNKKSRKIFS